MDKEYGDDRNPIIAKSEFVLSLFEQLAGSLTARRKVDFGSLHGTFVQALP